MSADKFDLLPGVVSHSHGMSATEERFGGNSLKKVVENYVRYYAMGPGHTARAKRYDLEYFLRFLAGSPEGVDDLTVSEWTMQKTKDFVDARITLGESPATVARRLATIKHFGRTLAERLPGYINPAREVKSPNHILPRPRGLNSEEIAFLRAAALAESVRKNMRFSAVRNRFLLELLLATGLRADEVRLLVHSQISDDLRWLKNVKTKGKRFRNVYLDTEIRLLLEEYLLSRELHLKAQFQDETSLPFHPRVSLLVSTYRARTSAPESFAMSPKSIWGAISQLGTIASALSTGSNIHIHPHRLRHTFAHGLLDASNDIRLVAQALGHSDVRTTMRYTERTEDEVAKAIEHKRAAERRGS
jgi:site-specific recombinase XerD